MSGLPTLHNPDELAEQWGYSPRAIRALARRLGACRVLGKTMRLTDEDANTVLEALKPCPSKGGCALNHELGHVGGW